MVLNKHEKLEDNKYLLDISIDKDTFNNAVKKVYLKQKNQIRLLP